MVGHHNFEAVLTYVKIFHLSLYGAFSVFFKVVNSHMIGCENYMVKLFLLLFVV